MLKSFKKWPSVKSMSIVTLVNNKHIVILTVLLMPYLLKFPQTNGNDQPIKNNNLKSIISKPLKLNAHHFLL